MLSRLRVREQPLGPFPSQVTCPMAAIEEVEQILWEFDQPENNELIREQRLMPKYEKGENGENDYVIDG